MKLKRQCLQISSVKADCCASNWLLRARGSGQSSNPAVVVGGLLEEAGGWINCRNLDPINPELPKLMEALRTQEIHRGCNGNILKRASLHAPGFRDCEGNR